MEQNERNVARWVEERLSALQPAADFRPDTAQALAHLRQRDRAYQVNRRRWFWGCAAAAAAGIAVMAIPTPCRAATSSSCGQPIANRLWDSVFHKPAVPAAAPPAAQAAPSPAPRAAVPPKPVPFPNSFKESGSPTAPITCEIYSDYECPACAAAFRDTVPLLVEQFVRTGKVRLLHRDFPLRQHHYSRTAARYANAAGRAGVYDLVVNQLFRTQTQWDQNGDIVSQLAAVLSPAALRQIEDLVKNPEFDDTVDADLLMGLLDHIGRTPSIVIVTPGKRQVIAGVPDFTYLKGYLDDLLPAGPPNRP